MCLLHLFITIVFIGSSWFFFKFFYRRIITLQNFVIFCQTSTFISHQLNSVQSLSSVRLFATPWITTCQASLASPTTGVHSNSHPLSRWCHLAISSPVVPFSSCPQSLPAAESFPMSQHFTRGGQSIGISALASVLPKNTQDWSPLEWTGWISVQSKGLSRVFSNTTAPKHQCFDTQLSLYSYSHTDTWLLEKP